MTPAQIKLNAAIARASFMTNGHRGRDWRSGRLFVAAGKGDEFEGCGHGKTFDERCIDCELVLAREGERWAQESLIRYRAKIAKLEQERETA